MNAAPTPECVEPARHPAWLPVVLRIAAALAGGYAFTWGAAALAIAGLAAAGMDFEEAEHAVMLLAFIVFLVAFLWAHACRSLVRVWVVLAGGGALMTLFAWLLQRCLLG